MPTNQDERIRRYYRSLPHWRLAGATYFVTLKLGTGFPKLSAKERSIVVAALKHGDGEAFELLAYVVMDDHAHVLVKTTAALALEKLVHSWKSFTTHALQRQSGRVGRIWQYEYFDRIVRNEREMERFARYILENPWRRWPGTEGYEWVGQAPGELLTARHGGW